MFYNPINNMSIAKLSVSMQDELQEWITKGYNVKSSSIRFIVAWKPKGEQKEESETSVLLLDMILSHTTDV